MVLRSKVKGGRAIIIGKPFRVGIKKLKIISIIQSLSSNLNIFKAEILRQTANYTRFADPLDKWLFSSQGRTIIKAYKSVHDVCSYEYTVYY